MGQRGCRCAGVEGDCLLACEFPCRFIWRQAEQVEPSPVCSGSDSIGFPHRMQASRAVMR